MRAQRTAVLQHLAGTHRAGVCLCVPAHAEQARVCVCLRMQNRRVSVCACACRTDTGIRVSDTTDTRDTMDTCIYIEGAMGNLSLYILNFTHVCCFFFLSTAQYNSRDNRAPSAREAAP